MANIKPKACKREGCNETFTPFRSTDRYCSFNCAKLDAKPKEIKFGKINKRSKKGILDDYKYYKKRKYFLSLPENKICFVHGCNNNADTIEHTKGRIGKNFLDVATWRPCCSYHNAEFERNTELSNKYQFSKFHDGKKIIK